MATNDTSPTVRDIPDGCLCIWTNQPVHTGWVREFTHRACPIHPDSQRDTYVSTDREES